MSFRVPPWLAAAILLPLGVCQPSVADPSTVSVAAASNLVYALDALNAGFRRAAPDVAVTTAIGASGALFAQIANGAPFDVFLSADTDYPRQLVVQGLGNPGTLRTFATGWLVLWTTRTDLDLQDFPAVLRHPSVKKVAIAQPKTAPYGRAAQAAMEKLGVWRDTQPKIVIGENISQTAQFIETGNADLGFVARSLLHSPRLAAKGRWQEVPPALYAGVPLEHAAVLTNRGAGNPAARRYLEYLASDAAKKILRGQGYGAP